MTGRGNSSGLRSTLRALRFSAGAGGGWTVDTAPAPTQPKKDVGFHVGTAG